MRNRSVDVDEGADLIDSRDVIERIKELEEEKADYLSESPSIHTPWTEDDEEELTKLKALAEDADCCGDWKDGATLISDDYFEDYARELAEDIGAIERVGRWPTNHIDWEEAADELKQDYMSVEFGSTTYWIRV